MESKVAKADKVHNLVNSEEQAVSSASRKPQVQSLGTQTSCLVGFSCDRGVKFERGVFLQGLSRTIYQFPEIGSQQP